MADLTESPVLRLDAPRAVFGGHYRHECMRRCGNVLVVPDPSTPGAPDRLEEGHIWACAACGALHEYYVAYGTRSRNAAVRLLDGMDVRTSGEPTVLEWVP